MKNNIEGEKSRNPIRKVAKRLVGPATALTLLFWQALQWVARERL